MQRNPTTFLRLAALALLSGGLLGCDESTTPDTSAPGLQIQAPAAGFATAQGEIVVSGTATDDRGVTRVTYQVNGGAEADVPITAGTTASFSFSAPLTAGNNTIAVHADDAAGNRATATVQGVRDGQPPVVQLTSPDDGGVIAPTVQVAGSATDEGSVARITYQVNGGAETEVAITPGATAQFSFEMTLGAGNNTVVVNAYDALGNRGSAQRTVERVPAGEAVLTVRMLSGEPLDDAQITAEAEGAAAPQVTGAAARAVVYSPNGRFGVENLGNGNYRVHLPTGAAFRLRINHPAVLPLIYSNVTVQQAATTYLEGLRLIPAGQAGPGGADIQVSDAFNGEALSGVTLTVRSGINATSGASVATATTDAGGAATIGNLAAGYYTVQMERSGYSTGYFSVPIVGGQNIAAQGSIAPAVASDQVRIILDWGETPRDLDSHLTGPGLEGSGRFHVYYGDPSYSDAEGLIAALDHDDVTSYGPETITIYRQSDGVYRYSVHDYTNRGSTSSTALAASGARVRLYAGANLLRTFYVPAAEGGTLWTVFELTGTTVTPINTMTYQNSPGAVTDLAEKPVPAPRR